MYFFLFFAKIPTKSSRILRRLIRVLRAGLCARAGACGGGPRRHPPSLKSPNAILELSDAKFAWIFGVISTDESRGTETSHVSPTMDLRVCQMKRRERAPHPQPIKIYIYKATCFLIMRYYFSHDHAFRLFLVPRRPRSVDDIERKKIGKLTSHDEDKNLYGFLCTVALLYSTQFKLCRARTNILR